MDWYLDNNAFDHLLDNGPPNPTISRVFRAQGIRIIISEHNIHEIVSCWKSEKPEKVQRGQKLIRYILDLERTSLLLPTPHLIRFEIAPMIHNVLPGPFLDTESETLTREQLLRFAAGGLREEDLANLHRRWGDKEKERGFYENLRQKESVGLSAPADEFRDFVVRNRRLAAAVAERIVLRYLTEIPERERRKIAKMAASRIAKCPALRSAVRANLLLSYRIMQGKKTRHDVWDDLCHCISATYADVFVTGDEELKEYFRQINLKCEVLGLSEFRERLGI